MIQKFEMTKLFIICVGLFVGVFSSLGSNHIEPYPCPSVTEGKDIKRSFAQRTLHILLSGIHLGNKVLKNKTNQSKSGISNDELMMNLHSPTASSGVPSAQNHVPKWPSVPPSSVWVPYD